jgi:hypothetical protein
MSHEIPFEGITMIIDDLHAFSDELGTTFSSLNAQGIIYLIKGQAIQRKKKLAFESFVLPKADVNSAGRQFL